MAGITAGSSARELNVSAGRHECRDATELGVTTRDGHGLETGLRDLEIMLLGISSCGIDPAGTKEQSICCTEPLSETTMPAEWSRRTRAATAAMAAALAAPSARVPAHARH